MGPGGMLSGGQGGLFSGGPGGMLGGGPGGMLGGGPGGMLGGGPGGMLGGGPGGLFGGGPGGSGMNNGGQGGTLSSGFGGGPSGSLLNQTAFRQQFLQFQENLGRNNNDYQNIYLQLEKLKPAEETKNNYTGRGIPETNNNQNGLLNKPSFNQLNSRNPASMLMQYAQFISNPNKQNRGMIFDELPELIKKISDEEISPMIPPKDPINLQIDQFSKNNRSSNRGGLNENSLAKIQEIRKMLDQVKQK